MNPSSGSSPINAETTTAIPPPKGWTTTLKELSLEFYWANDKGIGTLEAKSLGLTTPEPVMRSTPESGDCMYMFKSGSSYYIWNEIEGDVWQVTSPTRLEDIFSTVEKEMNKLVVQLVDKKD